MTRMPILLALLLLATLGRAAPVAAMQMTLQDLPGNRTVIDARGVILPGDFHRLLAFCNTLDKAERLIGLIVDSPGGNVLEAEKIAGTIRDMRLSVAVGATGSCASACFLMFAAAPTRLAAPGARIGVHRASLRGEETAGSLGATDGMAVQIEHFGIPPGIVAKLRATAPGGVTWLTEQDMAAMHVLVAAPEPRRAGKSAAR